MSFPSIIQLKREIEEIEDKKIKRALRTILVTLSTQSFEINAIKENLTKKDGITP